MNLCFHSRQRSWYQFNDEVVTKIQVLGDKKKGPRYEPIAVEADEQRRWFPFKSCVFLGLIPRNQSQIKCPTKKRCRETSGDGTAHRCGDPIRIQAI